MNEYLLILEARVNEGIKYLNGACPLWHSYIATGGLNMKSGNQCLLAHICRWTQDVDVPAFRFNNLYHIMTEILGLSYEDCIKFGFTLPDIENYKEYWYSLTKIWISKVEEIRSKGDQNV